MSLPIDATWVDLLNEQRVSRGYYSLSELRQLSAKGTTILDPFSTLISRTVELGNGNLFYPNVVVEAVAAGRVSIGDQNLFMPGTFIRVTGGRLTIGSHNSFGEGGLTVVLSSENESLHIRDGGRYHHGAHLSGSNYLGHGAQVLGAILMRGCHLGDGEDYRHPDPDRRGGVLKGGGFARDLRVAQGEVINGRATFVQEMVERQAVYHSS